MARKMEDLTGQRFGRLVVIGGYERLDGITYWDFQCDCGVVKRLVARSVKNGRVSSCGCYRKDATAERMTKHGHAGGRGDLRKKSIAYSTWNNILQRCLNPNIGYFDNYGGRGIKVCDRWLEFENFLADMGEPPIGLSIDRINNDRGYCKENCRWATRSEQNMNRRNTLYVEFRNERITLMDLSKNSGIPYNSLLYRYKNGWDMELAVSTPVIFRKLES